MLNVLYQPVDNIYLLQNSWSTGIDHGTGMQFWYFACIHFWPLCIIPVPSEIRHRSQCAVHLRIPIFPRITAMLDQATKRECE